MRLTNQAAAGLTLPPGRDKLVVFDDDLPGFGMSLSKGGSRSWVVQYRNALGQSKRETLGKVGVLSASDARRAASERLARAHPRRPACREGEGEGARRDHVRCRG